LTIRRDFVHPVDRTRIIGVPPIILSSHGVPHPSLTPTLKPPHRHPLAFICIGAGLRILGADTATTSYRVVSMAG
jgi:hypothetical protein